jgi:hypothetical protein
VSKGDGIAPNYFICDNLFQQMEMKVNGTQVGEIRDYVAQCATMKNRLFKDQSLKDSILSSINYSQIGIHQRINAISQDGTLSPITNAEELYGSLSRAETFANSNVDEAADTLALGAGNGVLTWVDAAGGDLDLQNDIVVGDNLKLTDGNGSTRIHEVTAVTQLTVTITPQPISAVAANVANHALLNISKVTKVDESNTLRTHDNDLIWKPTLGFWSISEALPMAKYEMTLYPFDSTSFQKYAVETLVNKSPGSGVLDFKVSVSDMVLYLYTVRTDPVSESRMFTWSDVSCAAQNITTTSLSSKVFNICPRNYAITVAYQDNNVGDDTTLSRSKFRVTSNKEQSIVRQYVQKGKVTLPDPIRSEQLSRLSGIQHISQRYYENFMYGNRCLDKVETLDEFINAGLFIHYLFGEYGCESVNVYSQFSENSADGISLLLFDHHHKTLSIEMGEGEIKKITCD